MVHSEFTEFADISESRKHIIKLKTNNLFEISFELPHPTALRSEESAHIEELRKHLALSKMFFSFKTLLNWHRKVVLLTVKF